MIERIVRWHAATAVPIGSLGGARILRELAMAAPAE
jgi:hypothetical protein